MPEVRGTVRVTQEVQALGDSDDEDALPAGPDGVGSYRDYEFTINVPSVGSKEDDEMIEELLLDEFHETVPIGCLQDFDIEVVRWNWRRG